MADESNFARRARTLTRLGLGAALVGFDKAGELLDTVANRAELPALLPGDPTVGKQSDRPALPAIDPPLSVNGSPIGSSAREPREAPALAAPANDARSTGPSSVRQLFVGTVITGEEMLVAATEAFGRQALGVGRVANRAWRTITPDSIQSDVDRRLEEFAARGREEVVLSHAEITDAVDQVVSGATGAEWLVGVVNQAIGNLIEPILETVLPVAIDKLNEDPALISGLVRDQSLGMAGQLANQVRTGAGSIDSGLERVARRLTMRRPRAELDGPAALMSPPEISVDRRVAGDIQDSDA